MMQILPVVVICAWCRQRLGCYIEGIRFKCRNAKTEGISCVARDCSLTEDKKSSHGMCLGCMRNVEAKMIAYQQTTKTAG